MSGPADGPVALLAWELGAGFGHARRLLTAARGLIAAGFRVRVCQRELWACAEDFLELGVPNFQAPHHRTQLPPGTTFRARGYADMMAVTGYQSVEGLLPTVLGWDALIDAVRPDVVVADYAPMLALAAHGRVPLVAIGDGFVLPPTEGDRFPVLRAGTAMADEAVLARNAGLVLVTRRQTGLVSLPKLIGGQARVVCTYPESDVYAGQRETPAAGPLTVPGGPLAPAPGGAVFFYLAADFPHTAKLLQALCDSRLPAEGFVRDAPESLRAALRANGIRLHDRPPALGDALARAGLVVHHGGIGTIESCLAAGRPQLLLPRHFEQTLNAEVLVNQGVARRLPVPFTLAEARAQLAESARSPDLLARAQAVADALAGRPGSLDTLVTACRALAA